MPKKLNFLGGMQNYNEHTGEYEPALTGANGQVVKDADGDGKAHEGGKKQQPYLHVSQGRKLSPKELDEETRKVFKTRDEAIKFAEEHKESMGEEGYANAKKRIDRAFPQEQDFNDPKEANRYKEQERDFNAPKKHDYSQIFDEDYQRSYGIPKFEDETDIKTLNDIVEKAMEYDGEEGAIDISNNAMERIGELTTFTEEEQDKLASGTGEEIMDILRSKERTTKNESRKDKYGNPLVSDEAFKVGQEAVKKYLKENTEDLETLKKSNVFIGGLTDEISDALTKAGLNEDYNLTYQDYNEIIGSVIGEEVDTEAYEENATKGWTGKKYSGYESGKEQIKPSGYIDDADKVALVPDLIDKGYSSDEAHDILFEARDEIVKSGKDVDYKSLKEYIDKKQPKAAKEQPKQKAPEYKKGVPGEDYTFYEDGTFNTKHRSPSSSFEEASVQYEGLNKFYGYDLEEMVYGENGFMKEKYPNGFPDFKGDILYSSKHWDEFEDWAKEKYGVDLDKIRKDNFEEYKKSHEPTPRYF